MRFGARTRRSRACCGGSRTPTGLGYLTKYITKDVAGTYDDDQNDRRQAHVDRLHRELRYLPCSERCANWLRYGIQPKNASPDLAPGFCDRRRTDANTSASAAGASWSPANGHPRPSPGTAPTERTSFGPHSSRPASLLRTPTACPADVHTSDGRPRFVWEPIERDHSTYAQVVMLAVAERRRWRAEYDTARAIQQPRSAMPP